MSQLHILVCQQDNAREINEINCLFYTFYTILYIFYTLEYVLVIIRDHDDDE
jgi:hypothetical protein